MPVMVLYRTQSVNNDVSKAIMQNLAECTKSILDAAIEVRVLEVVDSYNANDIHVEMRFRDFGEWTDDQLDEYHEKVMSRIERALEDHGFNGAFSFYILPSSPPRSSWSQRKISK